MRWLQENNAYVAVTLVSFEGFTSDSSYCHSFDYDTKETINQKFSVGRTCPPFRAFRVLPRTSIGIVGMRPADPLRDCEILF